MKRFIAAALLAAVMVVGLSSVAQAGVFSAPEELQWVNQNYSNMPGTGTGDRDTLWKQIKVGATDTTGTISTVGWSLPDGAVADSMVVGNLWVGVDSTATGTFTATSFTITPQWTVNGTTWTSGAAITFTDVTANDLMFKFPIYVVGNTTRGLLNTAGWPAPGVRYLIVAIGGVVSPARCWVTHLVDTN